MKTEQIERIVTALQARGYGYISKENLRIMAMTVQSELVTDAVFTPLEKHDNPQINVTGVELDVCCDIAARQAKGIAKYGQTVAENPLELKQWLQHAYEECLDQAIYLKRAISEMNK